MKNKRREYLFLSYSTYSLIALFIFAVLILFFVEVRDDTITVNKHNTNFEIPDVNLLNPEEVEAERIKLITLSEKPIYSEATTNSINSRTEQTGSEELVDQTSTNNSGNSHLVFLSDEEIEMVKSRGVITVNNQSSVNSNSDLGDTTNIFSLEGSIFSKDNSNNSIRIALKNNEGLATINLKEDTKILINGKNISFTDLKIASKIRAEGYGVYEDKIMTDTKVILVTGYHQIVPIN